MNIEIGFFCRGSCRVLTFYEFIPHQCLCPPASDMYLFVMVMILTAPNYSDLKFIILSCAVMIALKFIPPTVKVSTADGFFI